MNESNNDLLTAAQDAVETTTIEVAAPKQKAQKQKQTVLGADAEALIEIIAKSIAMSNQAQQDIVRQDKENKHLEQLNFHRDSSAKSLLDYKAKIRKEVEEGNYIEFDYNDALAEKYGAKQVIVVNGVSITLLKGYTTRVPKSLYNELRIRLGFAKLTDNKKRIIGILDDGIQKEDNAIAEEGIKLIRSELANAKINS